MLVPTRELATQVGETVRALLPALPRRLKAAIVFGGVSINPQMLHLRGGGARQGRRESEFNKRHGPV